jgi:hypothetical protein
MDQSNELERELLPVSVRWSYFLEVTMRTGQDVIQSGLYASDCCLEELRFDENGSFSRCPRCSHLAEWELVDVAAPWLELSQVSNDKGYEAA